MPTDAKPFSEEEITKRNRRVRSVRDADGRFPSEKVGRRTRRGNGANRGVGDATREP